MMLRFGLLLLMFAGLGFPRAALAGLSDVKFRSSSGVTTVEVVFSDALELDPKVVNGEVREFELLLYKRDARPGDAFLASQLQFDEAHHVVERVELQSDASDRVRLSVHLREKAYVEFLPQYVDKHVLFTLTPSRVRKALQRELVQDRQSRKARYVLTLQTRRASMPTLRDVPRTLAAAHTIYATPFERDGDAWQHLRVGFFADAKAARRAKAQVLYYFPDAKIERVAAEEVAFAQAYRLNPSLALRRTELKKGNDEISDVRLEVAAVTPSALATPRETPAKPIQWLAPSVTQQPQLDEADEAFRRQDYTLAVRHYTNLLETPDADVRRTAHERLGVSRELKGQFAHAVNLYRQYLTQYPEGPGAQRVQQRLAALSALSSDAPAALRKAKSMTKRWHALTSVSQFYRRHSLKIEGQEDVPIDGLLSDVSATLQHSGGRLEHEAQVSLTHLVDFTGELEGRDFQIGKAHWSTYLESIALGVQLGRQSKWDAGVIGRFDGATLFHRPTDNIEIGAVGGYLLDSSFDGPSSDRPVYGIYGSVKSNSDVWRVNPFVLEQRYLGVLDRRAFGFQAQYVRESTHLTALLDYDFHHGALNNVSIMADLGIGRRNSVNITMDQRRSPYLTTRNALIGQPYDELSELERELIDLELKELADDRTATMQSLRVGLNRRFDSGWQVSGDVLLSDISSTQDSMNVAALEARQDVYYTFQIRALDVYGASSYSGLTMRQADSDQSTTQSVYWDNRFRLGRQWSIQPRLRFDYRQYDVGDQTQTTTRPSLRVNYRWNRRVRFEFETGYEMTNREMSSNAYEISGFFINAGYRAVF